MAWTIVKKDLCAAADPIVTIIMDADADASDLPTTGCAAGSVAIVADSGAACYMLNASGTWTAL
jgi:hypothetical protein